MRIIDSMTFINVSLEVYVKIFLTKFTIKIVSIAWKDCKKYKERKDGAVEWSKRYKKCKKLSGYCKQCKKYMRTVIIVLNTKKQ